MDAPRHSLGKYHTSFNTFDRKDLYLMFYYHVYTGRAVLGTRMESMEKGLVLVEHSELELAWEVQADFGNRFERKPVPL